MLVAFGALVAVLGFSIFNSRYFEERRLAKFEAELRRESVAALRERVSKSDYWTLTEKAPLRETDTAKEFFRRFDAEKDDEILSELGDGDFMCSVFYAAELSIGYRDRPMLMDYSRLFVPVLKELRRREITSPP